MPVHTPGVVNIRDIVLNYVGAIKMTKRAPRFTCFRTLLPGSSLVTRAIMKIANAQNSYSVTLIYEFGSLACFR